MAVMIGRGSLGGIDGFGTNTVDAEADENTSEDERIASGIQKIEFNGQKTSKVAVPAMVTQLQNLVPSIGSASDSEHLRRNVHRILQDTNTLTKQTGQLLKTYSQQRPEDEKEYAEWKVNSERFKKIFQEVLHQYQAIQKDTRVRERTSLRQSLIKSGYHDIEISDSGEIVKDGRQVQLEQIKEEENLKIIKEREAALKQLEKDIVDINGIFKDLSDMIQDQGEEITVIEENVSVAEENITIAVKDLREASDNVTAMRKKKVAAAIIGAIIVTIIIVIILLVTLS